MFGWIGQGTRGWEYVRTCASDESTSKTSLQAPACGRAHDPSDHGAYAASALNSADMFSSARPHAS